MPDSNISDNPWGTGLGFSPADSTALFGGGGNFDAGYNGGGWFTSALGEGGEGLAAGPQSLGITNVTPEMLAAIGFKGPGFTSTGEGSNREQVVNPDLYSFMRDQGLTYAERYNGESEDSKTNQFFDRSGAGIKDATSTWKLGNDDAFGIAMLLAGGLVGGAAAGVGAAGAGGGGAAAAGVGAGGGGLASTDLAAIFGPAGYGEAAGGAAAAGGGATAADLSAIAYGPASDYGIVGAPEVGGGVGGAGGLSAAPGGSSAEKASMYGAEGYGPAASPAEMAAGNGGILSNLFGSGFGFNLGTARQGYGLLQTISALYGLSESNKIKRNSRAPGITKAGMDAVTRSMAAQGYQGSGNMAAALERYGAESNRGDIAGQTQGLTGQLSSLGLLTGGLGTLFGWGKSAGGG